MYINLSKKWPDKCEIVDISTEFTVYSCATFARRINLFCIVPGLFCFVFFYFLRWTELPIPTAPLHFLYLRPTFCSSSLAISTGFNGRSVFFSGMHDAIATAWVFARTFLHFTAFRHDVMSKLFWVENKVILEKCSVFKQPNRLGNSTELNSGEEFLARGCDFTTTWNLWSLSL